MTNQDAYFSDIRPLVPEEIPEAIDELFADETFCALVSHFFPDVPHEAMKAQLKACQTLLDFQKAVVYPLVKGIMTKCATSVALDAEALAPEERTQPCTFISNHRDIVLDSAFLDVLLIEGGFDNTIEIAIGDNLLIYPWIETLVRLNKSFIVKRSLAMREFLMASRKMSEYMHYAINTLGEGIWMAQREGRAKDSNDRTQEAILKMMCMSGEGSPADRLRALNIVPLAISYEYDPCDFLKAKEFQQKRDDPSFKKSRQDDLTNMQTGIMGEKGRVQYRLAAPVNTWIDEVACLPKGEFFKAVATRMDRAIHRAYELFPANYVALDLLNGTAEHTAHYSAEDKAHFEQRIAERIALIDLPGKDEAFLRERLLTMYANPLKNHLAAQA